MNYTTNYHLPQWVETDRIMMEDFNEAMAGIDGGIAGEAAARAEAIADLEQSVGQTQGQIKTDLLDRMRRSGYDLYQVAGRGARADLFQFAAKGMVINGLHTAEELARAEQCAPLDGGGIQIGPSTGLSMDKLNSAVYEWADGTAASVGAAATASVKFRSVGKGTVTKLNVWYHRTSYSDNKQLTLYVQLYDQDTGERVYRSSAITGKVMSSTDTQDTLTTSVPIEGNRHYRLELYTSGCVFSGTIGFGTMGANTLSGTVTSQPITSCSVTDTMSLEIPAEQAVALVHYSGGSQAPTVTLGGQAMAAKSPKSATALDGTNCTELEFFLAGSFSGEQTLVTSIQSSSNMILHDTGVYFI